MSNFALELAARLKRLFVVTASVFGVALAGYVALTVLSLLIVFLYFPFSGGSGRGLNPFMDYIFNPLIAFCGGALAFGGIAAIVSAVVASGRLWLKTIAIVAVVGGLITAMSPPLQGWLSMQVAPILDLLKKLLLTPI